MTIIPSTSEADAQIDPIWYPKLVREVDSFTSSGGMLKLYLGPPGTGKTYRCTQNYRKAFDNNEQPVLIVFARAAKESAQSRLPEAPESSIKTLDSIAYHRWIIDGSQELLRQSHPATGALHDFTEETEIESMRDWQLADQENFFSPLKPAYPETIPNRSIPPMVGARLHDWLKNHQLINLSDDEVNLFNQSDNPASPGVVWNQIYTRERNLIGVAENKRTPEIVAIRLWHLWLMLHKAFNFTASLRHLAETARYPTARVPSTVIVDEAQDLTPLQVFTILRLARNNGTRELHFVGDPHQSIMGFRHATPEVMTRVLIPKAKESGTYEQLSENRRSLKSIVDLSEIYRQRMPQNAGDMTLHAQPGGIIQRTILPTGKEIADMLQRLAVSHSVMFLCTNRYVDAWESTQLYLQQKEIPYQGLSSGGSQVGNLMGSAGYQITRNRLARRKGKSDSWSFPEYLNQPMIGKPWLLKWVSEYITGPDSPDGHVHLSKLVSAIVIFDGIAKTKWEEKLPPRVIDQIAEKEEEHTIYNYSTVLSDDISISLKEAEALVVPDAVDHLYDLSKGRTERLLENFGANRVFNSTLAKGISHSNNEAVALCVRMLDLHGPWHAENPNLSIGTVHESKGKEADIVVAVPTGPPSMRARKWNDSMYYVHYVALSRPRYALILCTPTASHQDARNTFGATSYQTLLDSIAGIKAKTPDECLVSLFGIEPAPLVENRPLRSEVYYSPTLGKAIAPPDTGPPIGAI